jgi:hypothetical protein
LNRRPRIFSMAYGMDLSTVTVIIASLLAAAGLVYYLLSRGREDPATRGLPTSPPAVNADVQPAVDLLFRTRSNCWEANRWLREDVVALLQQDVREDELVRRFLLSGADLDKKCPAGTYVEVDGQRRSVPEAVRSLAGML